jgi:hypothetical protein
MTRPTPSEAAKQLGHWLDAQGRLVQWPTKYTAQRMAVNYLVAKFERGRRYSEAEVNEVLEGWSLFRDAALLRRTMIEEKLLERTADGREYWLSDT